LGNEAKQFYLTIKEQLARRKRKIDFGWQNDMIWAKKEEKYGEATDEMGQALT
jgi:hypothetical protein